MQPTVIEPPERAGLMPWADAQSLPQELLGFNREPPGGGIESEGERSIRSWAHRDPQRVAETASPGPARPMDAPGFEPGASPLQGERSTADLRAPCGVRRLALSYLNDSSQSPRRVQRVVARRWT